MNSMPEGSVQSQPIEGQLNLRERELLTNAIVGAPRPVRVALEVGTWLGGGSTLHILRALEKCGCGHLCGIEASREVYERMVANIKAGAPEALHRFTPLFGFSQQVIPKWLGDQPKEFAVDFAFLDGGNNPMEQIVEFRLIEARIPVGGQVMAHDAKARKGKWLVPYLSRLDNWQTQLHDVSVEGLLHAVKLAARPSPQSLRKARWHLLKSRSHPVEFVAALLPPWANGFLLGVLPRKIAMLLSDGRKSGAA